MRRYLILAGLLLSFTGLLSADFKAEISQFANSSGIMKHSQQRNVQSIAAKPELGKFMKTFDNFINLIPDWTTYQVKPEITKGVYKYTVQVSDKETLTLGFNFVPPKGIQHIVTPEGSHVVFGLKSDLPRLTNKADQVYPYWRLINQILEEGLLFVSVPRGKTFVDSGECITSLGIGFRQLFQLMNWEDPDGDEVNSPESSCMVRVFENNPWLLDEHNQIYWSFSGGQADDRVWTLDRELNFFGCRRDVPGSDSTIFIFHWTLL